MKQKCNGQLRVLLLIVLLGLLVLLTLRRQLMQPSGLPISLEQRPAKGITVKWWRSQRKLEQASELQDGLTFLKETPAPGWPMAPRAWYIVLGFLVGFLVLGLPRPVAPPSDAAVRKLLSKVGGTLEQAVDSELIDWSGKGLDSDDARVVARVVAISGSLKVLNLGRNWIGNEGATAIAEALRVNGSLRQLILYDNTIGDAGAAAIAEALRVNDGSITSLDLSNNKIGDAGAAAIAAALRVGGSLQELYLGGNGSLQRYLLLTVDGFSEPSTRSAAAMS